MRKYIHNRYIWCTIDLYNGMFISIYNIDQIIKNLVDAATLIKHFNKYIIFTQVINEKKKKKVN